MIRPEEIPTVVMQMALAGEAPEQIEALEWTFEHAPDFLQWMTYPQQEAVVWKCWPLARHMTEEQLIAWNQWIARCPIK